MPYTGASITETFIEHISICILLKKLKQSIDLKADTKYDKQISIYSKVIASFIAFRKNFSKRNKIHMQPSINMRERRRTLRNFGSIETNNIKHFKNGLVKHTENVL